MSYSAPEDAPDRRASAETPREYVPAESPAERPGADQQAADQQTADQPGEIPHTRTARAHNALIAGAVVLILLLVFILENTRNVKVTYFGAGFQLPLGVALLLAAIGGALLVGIVGTARIVQLRRRVRHPR
jgi:uncharacterized integral membrane protein